LISLKNTFLLIKNDFINVRIIVKNKFGNYVEKVINVLKIKYLSLIKIQVFLTSQKYIEILGTIIEKNTCRQIFLLLIKISN
jgi:hypothetical protein